MDTKISQSMAQSKWHIVRRFDGSKGPVALLKALIQAHKA